MKTFAPTPTAVGALPPVGPAWFPVVMGTAILALLLQLHAGGTPIGHLSAAIGLILAWVLLACLGIGFARHCRRTSGALRGTLHTPASVAMWGTVAMAILATGSATLAVGEHAAWAVRVDAVLWSVGTLAGLATTAVFGWSVFRGAFERPTMVWGLAVVAPMVSATGGATLATALPAPWRSLVWWICAMCFLVALLLAGAVFAAAYHHHLRIAPLPLELSATSWIPLGVIGQSMAAATALGSGTPAESIAHVYGFAMLLLAVPVVGYAFATTLRGFARRMPFATNWWSLTFPIGTLSLGCHLLGAAVHSRTISLVSTVALVVLVGTWKLCAVATVRAVIRQRRSAHRHSAKHAQVEELAESSLIVA